jgi:hypothetical protein
MPQNAKNDQSKRTARTFFLLPVLLFLCCASVAAIPISDYQQNIKRAITALESLDNTDEEEAGSEYEKLLAQTIETVRTALPAYQTVELDGETCNVDNSWVHKTLDEFKEPTLRLDRITELMDSLRAIEARVAERQKPGQLVDSKTQAKSKLESILARPEYAGNAKGTNALTRLLRDFFRWLRKFFPERRNVDAGRANLISMIARYLVIGAALFVLGYVVKILLARFKRERKKKAPKSKEPRIVLGERLEPDETAKDLLAEAEALARNGDLRAAIRKAYIALLVELGDRKMLSLAQYKTNRDYLNALRNAPQLHSKMRGLTDSFERHWYGFAQATQSDWQDFRARYSAALQTGN